MIGGLIIGALLCTPLFLLVRNKRFWENAHPVEATVIGMDQANGTRSRRKKTYRPVYRYTLADGQTFTASPSFFTDRDSVREKQKGSVETILVHNTDPTKICMTDYSLLPLYIFAIPLGCIGMLVLIAAFIYAF